MSDSLLKRRLLGLYVALIVTILYIPMVVVGLASISRSRFFVFPIKRHSMKWYEDTFASLQVEEAVWTSLTIAFFVAILSVLMAVFGALAYARFNWKGRKLYQQVLLILVFFPQAVLGLAIGDRPQTA